MPECPNCGSYHVMSLEQPSDKTSFYECHECGEVFHDDQPDDQGDEPSYPHENDPYFTSGNPDVDAVSGGRH